MKPRSCTCSANVAMGRSGITLFALKIRSAITVMVICLTAGALSSCTVTHHWKTYAGPELSANQRAVLKTRLSGISVTSIDGWTVPERVPTMAWDVAYDLTPGVHRIEFVCEEAGPQLPGMGGVSYNLIRLHRLNLSLDARQGHSYKLLGGQNVFTPGYSSPRIVDLTTGQE